MGAYERVSHLTKGARQNTPAAPHHVPRKRGEYGSEYGGGGGAGRGAVPVAPYTMRTIARRSDAPLNKNNHSRDPQFNAAMASRVILWVLRG